MQMGNGGHPLQAAIRTEEPYTGVVEFSIGNAKSLFSEPAGPRYYRLYGYAGTTLDRADEDYLEDFIDIRIPDLDFTTSDICCYNVSFNGTTDLDLTNCTWDFGDGINLSGKVVVREINQTITANLTVYDRSEDGVEHCSNTSRVRVTFGTFSVPAISNMGIMVLIGVLAVLGILDHRRRRAD
ncbi:MAG: hypothetical protein ACXQTX_06690 [Candidatus Syntropharchaeia archaeon]